MKISRLWENDEAKVSWININIYFVLQSYNGGERSISVTLSNVILFLDVMKNAYSAFPQALFTCHHIIMWQSASAEAKLSQDAFHKLEHVIIRHVFLGTLFLHIFLPKFAVRCQCKQLRYTLNGVKKGSF